MSEPGQAPDSPETGDVDTESLYGQQPGPAQDDTQDEADAVPELGAEDDLVPGDTGALEQG